MNVLFIADIHPKAHNLKWIFHLSKVHNIRSFIVSSKQQLANATEAHLAFLNENGITVLEPIDDYSTLNIVRTFRDSLRLKKYIKKYNIDLVHIMYAEPNALWALWKKRLNKRLVLTTRGTDVLHTVPSFFARKDWLGKIIQWEYKKAFQAISTFTCTSQSQQESVQKIGGIQPIHLVRTGVDYLSISESNIDMKNLLGISKEVILMPRSMYPLYNHEFTLEAISQLDQSVLKMFTFVFVNADTTDQAYLETIKLKAGRIDADIRFFPAFSPTEIYSLYKQSRMVIMNPLSDGSAVSAMEGMACGTPVILPPLPYDEDIFGNHVFKLRNWNVEELRDHILSILDMPENEMAQLLNNAQAHIVATFTLENQMRIMHSIYDTLMGHSQHDPN